VRDVSSPSPEQVEYAKVLLRRAKGDLQICRKLADDTDIDDNIFGFHAQQAAEKALKTALVLQDVEMPLTHDLGFLVRRVRESGIEPPGEFSDAQWLTPWAAELRYDEPIALDRAAALAVAESAAAWAAALLDDSASDVPPAKNREEISGGSSPHDPP
jgi:HEPN domain-containing protein